MLRRDGRPTGGRGYGFAAFVRVLAFALAAQGAAACGGSDGGGGGTGGEDGGRDGFVRFDVDVSSRFDTGPDTGAGRDDATRPDGNADAEDDGGPDNVDPGCQEFLEPCEFNPDCCDEWCVIGPDGFSRVCSKTCVVAACPDGWGCTQVGTPPDVQFICLPRRPPTCFQPCRSDADCTTDNRCLHIGDGFFCSRGCDDGLGNPNESRCASDQGEYTCADATSDDGVHLGFHCQPVSGSCVCGPEIDLQNDPNNCGSCGRYCDFDHADPLCERGECARGPCDDGWVDLNEEPEDGCEYECTFESEEDFPDPLGADSNCDGIDGVLARSVFVAPSGADDGNTRGDREHPFRSIGAAIAFAAVHETRKDVLVSMGTYEEQVNVRTGVNLYGGYNRSEGWRRSVADNTTYVVWNAVENGAIRTLVVLGGDAPTVVDGFTVRSGNNPLPGGSSYAVYVTHVGKEFVLSHNRIDAGSGADGLDGSDGVPGQDGPNGAVGEVGKPDWCNTDYFVVGGEGGVRSCGSWDASGGGGGYAGYGKESGWFCDGRPNGEDGEDGATGAAGGGGGGYQGNGGPGESGIEGTPGANGTGGAAAGQTDTFGLWQPARGGDGSDGTHGQGGGGGGGGGGKEVSFIIFETGTYHGGGGGGGGAGGCGGTGGTGGGGGGGSFAVFVLQASPTLHDNVVIHGSGGDGGEGGRRGTGGRAGLSGGGGAGFDGSGSGADGGDGGRGGHGGHGAGGAGGPAFGIYLVQANATVCEDNTFQVGGTGGTGGPGGDALDASQKGDDGPWGDVNVAVVSCPGAGTD